MTTNTQPGELEKARQWLRSWDRGDLCWSEEADMYEGRLVAQLLSEYAEARVLEVQVSKGVEPMSDDTNPQAPQPHVCKPSCHNPCLLEDDNPRAGSGKPAELTQSDLNHAYQFMHAWLVQRNPRYKDHRLKPRLRRNRLAELLCEYAASLRAPEAATSAELEQEWLAQSEWNSYTNWLQAEVIRLRALRAPEKPQPLKWDPEMWAVWAEAEDPELEERNDRIGIALGMLLTIWSERIRKLLNSGRHNGGE